jgi:quercetin dioxygenase-like cupin family protein
MEIMSAGSRPSKRASADWFTGTVWQDPIIQAPEPARVAALRVSFEPGARTAWHSHPLGQTLHVLSGVGLVGLRKAAPGVIRPGDTVWIPPGEEHWHGATADTGMVHLAMQEMQDGRAADWLEQVSDQDYARAPADP